MPNIKYFTHDSISSLNYVMVEFNSPHDEKKTKDDFNAGALSAEEDLKAEPKDRLYLPSYRYGTGHYTNDEYPTSTQKVNREEPLTSRDDVLAYAPSGDPNITYYFMALTPTEPTKQKNLVSLPKNLTDDQKRAFLALLYSVGQKTLLTCDNCCEFLEGLRSLLR